MLNYQIPLRGKGVDEAGYQRVVRGVLKDAGHSPQLMRPKAKYGGECWSVYAKA